MIDIGYVALDNAQSPALAATNPYSLAKVPEIADQPYGAPRHTWVTKAGTNIDHRLAFPLLSTAASGAKRPPLPERVFGMIMAQIQKITKVGDMDGFSKPLDCCILSSSTLFVFSMSGFKQNVNSF